MKKKYVVLSIITLVLLTTFLTSFNYFKTTNNCVEDSVNNQTKITKGISMNLEQTVGAGDYKTVTQSNWPTEGYKFNTELSKCENGSTLSWDDTNKKVIVSGNTSDKCYVYFDIVPTLSTLCRNSDILATCIKKYGDIGTTVSNIYIHNSSLTNGAEDNSYRYAGASDQVNNFVCFGSTINPCPTDNLYRIIGVIDGKVKLIKYDYASRNLLGTTGESPYQNSPSSNYQGTLTDIDIYHISSPGINDWSESPLNQTNLNTSFINNIGTTWASKIITTTWKVGGGAQTNIMQSVPKISYQYEVGSSASSTTYAAKIGLMYVSDYYFAAGPSAWTLVGHNSDSTKDYRIAITINWMYMGFDEWTLTPSTNDSESTFGIYSDGSVASGFVGIDMYGVRPVFNLDTSVTYVSGDGTKSSPIIIN